MTEIDVKLDLQCCLKKLCEHCSLEGEEGCAERLQRDAISVLKMQSETLAVLNKNLKALESERDNLKEKAELGLVKN
jgi:hypothetical protein